MATATLLSTLSTVLAIQLDKCCHIEKSIKYMSAFPNHTLIATILQRDHDFKGADVSVIGTTDLDGSSKGNGFSLESGLTVGDIRQFGVKCITFKCKGETQDASMNINTLIDNAAADATRKTLNAFELLMSNGRGYPDKKTTSAGIAGGRLSRKDELFNDIVEDFFRRRHLNFPRLNANTEGSYIAQVLCNALWYITNQHTVINDASKKKEVLSVPGAFEQYQGYNDLKRKKLKCLPMEATGLESHSQALYSILQKPVMNASEAWKEGASVIQKLADCLSAYKVYLESKNTEERHNHSLQHPVRTIAKDATVEHRSSTNEVLEKYTLLDAAVREAVELQPIFFDEELHLVQPFDTPLQRFRYIKDLRLSSPVDLVRFSPGGSTITSLFLCKVQKNRSDSQMMVEGARLLQNVRPKLLEYHTRSMRKAFKEKMKNVTGVSPSILDFIYKELAMDGSMDSHPVTQERLRLISLGHTNLLADLRHSNPGRPNTKFDTFFDALGGLVEQITAADDRRHGEAHLSEFISLREMVDKATALCPPDTNIPSNSLVRLQFAPRNCLL